MSQAPAETTYLENPFGTVTDRRVVYYRKKSWFSGGSREDVPLKHVTSVRVETFRSIGWGILLILFGWFLIVPAFLGILLLWGSPVVVVSTAGGDREVMKGWPWDRQLAEDFARALRNQLFRE